MPLKNYRHLHHNIKNWLLYFKRKYSNSTDAAIYITRGNELKFQVPNHFFFVFKEIFMEDFYELEKLMPLVPDNATIVDIGANVGFFSFLMAAKRKHAVIYAYEPIGDNLRLFKSNLQRNSGLSAKINCYQKAVTGKEMASVKLYFDDVNANTVISSVFQDFSSDNNNVIEIEAISLEKIIMQNALGSIDVLKLDCEGSEYPILYDSPESVWHAIKCLCIEVHELDKEKRNYLYLSKFLEEKGYRLNSRLDANGCYYLLAWK